MSGTDTGSAGGAGSATETSGRGGAVLDETPRTAALSSWIGSVLEYYGFAVCGTAAAPTATGAKVTSLAEIDGYHSRVRLVDDRAAR